MELRIDNPFWLLALAPFLAYFSISGARAFKRWNRLARTVFLLRSAAVFLLIFALTDPYIYRLAEKEQILFLLDRSASMKNTEGELLQQINEAVSRKKENQHVGVFSFAEDYQSLVPVSSRTQAIPADLPIQKEESTNISQALRLAGNSGNSELPTRIVLLSDGNETAGSAFDTLLGMDLDRVTIDVFPVSRQHTADAAVTSFETPSLAFLGEAQQFKVAVTADQATAAELVISKNDEDIDRRRIELLEGQNEFVYTYPATEEGLTKYEAEIELEEDGFIENNKLTSVTEVAGIPRLLIVSQGGASPVADWLDTERIDVVESTPEELPSALSSLLAYDAIIFDNVPATKIGEQQMTVIEQSVKSFGTGFMMIGGEQSFGLGGYFKTPIERILPVEMEVKGKHELPSLGLMIVMDRSGSMAGIKMELAKEAAARSVELLRPEDTVGVIAFDDRPWEVVPTAPLKNPEEAVNSILSVTPGGGTEIYTSLESAYDQLADLELQRKHIILLTDGQSSSSADYESLIETGKEKNITLSTVAIGQDADKSLLEMLAASGSGRFYDVTDATTVPAILSRETVMMSRTFIVDEPFHPIVYDSYWASLFADGVPKLNAYIASTAKQTAAVALESPQEDPVLAEWNFGLGRTIAYTSGSDEWSGDFLSWNRWPEFWNQTVARLLPAYAEIPFSIHAQAEESFLVEDPSGASAIIDVAAVNEQGQELEVRTEPVAPGKVEITVDADPGLVFFSISNEQGEAHKIGVTIPYGEEYRQKEANHSLLSGLAEKTGGKTLEDLNESFRDVPASTGVKQPFAETLILLAMLLFFLDITVRRFGLTIPAMPVKSKQSVKEEQVKTIDKLIKAKKNQ